MNRIIIILFLIVNISEFYAQENYIKLPNAKEFNATFIFNNKIIGSENSFKSYGESKDELKKMVKDVSILIDKPNKDSHNYYNLTEHGIIFVELKENTPILGVKTQAELNSFFNLSESSGIYIDGYLIENKNYRISLVGISDIEIIYPNDTNKLTNATLNIWTLEKSKRYKSETD